MYKVMHKNKYNTWYTFVYLTSKLVADKCQRLLELIHQPSYVSFYPNFTPEETCEARTNAFYEYLADDTKDFKALLDI